MLAGVAYPVLTDATATKSISGIAPLRLQSGATILVVLLGTNTDAGTVGDEQIGMTTATLTGAVPGTFGAEQAIDFVGTTVHGPIAKLVGAPDASQVVLQAGGLEEGAVYFLADWLDPAGSGAVIRSSLPGDAKGLTARSATTMASTQAGLFEVDIGGAIVTERDPLRLDRAVPGVIAQEASPSYGSGLSLCTGVTNPRWAMWIVADNPDWIIRRADVGDEVEVPGPWPHEIP
jgi:hypothetical protein